MGRRSATIRLDALVPFSREHAESVAAWAAGNQDLFWLAPHTRPPLTVEKVRAWHKPGVHPFMYRPSEEPDPIGYGEINDLRYSLGSGWVGHLVIDPAYRGRGHGRAFLRQLTAYGFRQLGYRRIYMLVFPENHGAVKCYQAAGYVLDGYEPRCFEAVSGTHRMARMVIRPTRSLVR